MIEKARTAALIDEIPVLAVLGAASEEGLEVRDAGELRVKETDRIATIAENFRRMGLAMEVRAGRISHSRTARVFMPRNWILSAITASPWLFRWLHWRRMALRPSKAPRRLPCLFPNSSIHYTASWSKFDMALPI